MALTALFLCLTLGLTRASLDHVRSRAHPTPIPTDGTPMPTDCVEDQWYQGTTDYPHSGSFRPHVGTKDHPASCSRFWRCNAPSAGKQSATLYECPPCPAENPECKGHPLLVFDINTKSCNFPPRVDKFFVVGECDCKECLNNADCEGNDAACYPWGDKRAGIGPIMKWCDYCEDGDCVPGCLENHQCAVGLICKDHKCVVPDCPVPADECDCNDADSCGVCSTCQAIVTYKCTDPKECCADNPCPNKCEDCIDGICKPRECGACNECDLDDGECKPKECGCCEECNLENSECEPIDCGPCGECDPDTQKCKPKDCGSCSRCNPDDGECVPVECGNCSECNPKTDQCEPKPCDEPCHECNPENGECESCCGTCTECDKDADACKPKECSPCERCNAKGDCEPVDCGNCSTCNPDTDQCEPDTCDEKCHECNPDNGECEPRCGLCTICDEETDECKPKDCGCCNRCNPDDGECEPVDCGKCSKCNPTTDQCEPKTCDEKCHECNIETGDCESSCGTCTECDEDADECKPKECPPCERCNAKGDCEPVDCGNCSTCNPNTDQCERDTCEEKCHECNIENGKCESCCGPCTDCDEKTNECKPRECDSCHTCNTDNDKCEEVYCGECGECNVDANECQGNQDKCKPSCDVPDCQECIGMPGKNQFICQDICADSPTCEGCCCIDDHCKDFCEEDQAPECNCEEHKCVCHDLGKIVLNEILICTEKCEGCDRTENMILNLKGEQFLWGYPTCETAEIKVPTEGDCKRIGAGLDNDICGGCYQYPLGGDIDEASTVEWLSKTGAWSGSFCVSWLPADNMYVKCDVINGVVDDCDEVCDCHDLSRTVCPEKKSAKSRKSSGILGWFK